MQIETGDTGLMPPRAAREAVLEMELLVVCAGEALAVKLSPNREYTIGRDRSCDIVVDDSAVSRAHVRLAVGVREATITDLGSSNGTSIAGSRLTEGVPSKLVLGAIVEVGSATMLLQPVRPHAPSLPPARTHVRSGPLVEADVGSRVVVDPAMRELYGTLDVVAPSQIAILVLGETGVGKEVLASEVHRRSRRSSAPFIAMNCAALPDSILEAELFGYERGAFTGANQTKVGLFEAADGGTIFLDEIGDMPIATQAKVLRVLESGEILRLGSVKSRRVDVRLVAATNRDIPRMIEKGQFRADLFFRLNGVTLSIPPLRQRTSEILPLAMMFIERAARLHGRRVPILSPEAAEHLVARSWPGNVRQLRNTIERAVVMCNGPIVRVEHLGPSDGFEARIPDAPSSTEDVNVSSSSRFDDVTQRRSAIPEGGRLTLPAPSPSSSGVSRDLPGELKALERERIIDALSRFAGNQSQAARHLGMSRTTLIARIREYNLARPRKVIR